MTSPVNEPSEPLANSSRDFDAVIVGAGFSACTSLHSLSDRLGLLARVFEAAEGVGGCHSDSYV
jgi:cation diffusion facilitator CzcD-associated flavoprotein CzcO